MNPVLWLSGIMYYFYCGQCCLFQFVLFDVKYAQVYFSCFMFSQDPAKVTPLFKTRQDISVHCYILCVCHCSAGMNGDWCPDLMSLLDTDRRQLSIV